MEPITQGLLGAAVAQAGWRRRLGRSALFWGALVALLPDLDVIFVGLHRGWGEFLYHRGTSHSLWFGCVLGPALGWAIWRGRGRGEPISAWVWLCIAALVTHPLLDAFTPYGTQLFAPFDRMRVAWQGVAIIDPAYSAVLAVAVIVGARRRTSAQTARVVAWGALALSTAYLLFGVWLGHRAADRIAQDLRAAGTPADIVRVYPTFLQSFLRRVVARGPDGIRVGLHTPFGDGRAYWEGHFREAPPNALTRDLHASWEGRTFVWFAMDEIVTAQQKTQQGHLITIEDLRYGLPGARAHQGLWGIQASYGLDGARIGEIHRFTRRRSGRVAPILGAMWHATWGDYSHMDELNGKLGLATPATRAPKHAEPRPASEEGTNHR